MKTLFFSKETLTDLNLQRIAKLLLESKTVIFPTETVYGLGACVFKEDAVEKIYNLKQRSKEKSLSVLLGKIEDVEKVAQEIPDDFYLLAEKFFPGPLSVILKKHSRVPTNVSKDATIAVRMPNHDITLKLINYVQDPIIGTSANISNEKSPVCVKEVMKDFINKIDIIIDGGECKIKIPSTIISLVEKPYKILRKGSILEDQIFEALKF